MENRTVQLVYWLNLPPTQPLHKIAKDLGFTPSGWVAPKHIRNPRTLIIKKPSLTLAYDELDATLDSGTPLAINLEHFRIITQPAGDWPLSAYDWLQRLRSVGLFMRARYPNRLIGNWGLRMGSDNDLNALYVQDYTCGVLSTYRRQPWSDRGWRDKIVDRYNQTALAGKPIQLDSSPVSWPGGGGDPRTDARPTTPDEWQQMITVTRELDPRWGCYWANRFEKQNGFTDEFHERSMAVMAEGLK